MRQVAAGTGGWQGVPGIGRDADSGWKETDRRQVSQTDALPVEGTHGLIETE